MADISLQQSQQIAQYASNRLGQQVGNGECFTLVDRALRAVPVKSAADYGEITEDADYRWGREIELPILRSGDVIQFRDYEVTVTTVTRTSHPDGSWEENTETQTQSRPHHTAIVSRTGTEGTVWVYEQNVQNVRQVQENQLFLKSRIDAPQTSVTGGVTTTVNRTVSVSGTVWLYRPQT